MEVGWRDGVAAGGSAVVSFLAIKPVLIGAGVVSGVSAPGITSALVAIGFGGMVGGVATVAAIPLLGAAIGWGGYRGYKYLNRKR